jgi:alkylated DNA repair dioxygenase AlkB
MYQTFRYENDYDFQNIWNAHPSEQMKVLIYNKQVVTPRWVQAYGRDYAYSGQVAQSLPIPDWLEPFFQKAKDISSTINGALINWYDGSLKHKIGAHRDNESDLMIGSDIITISLGEERIFRFRKFKTKEPPIDLVLKDRDILVIPWKTNIQYTHEVPHFAKYKDKRISLTFRTFL